MSHDTQCIIHYCCSQYASLWSPFTNGLLGVGWGKTNKNINQCHSAPTATFAEILLRVDLFELGMSLCCVVYRLGLKAFILLCACHVMFVQPRSKYSLFLIFHRTYCMLPIPNGAWNGVDVFQIEYIEDFSNPSYDCTFTSTFSTFGVTVQFFRKDIHDP